MSKFAMMAENHRIDKWLWCVRLYKTRTLASAAVKAGKVKLNGEATKSSRELKMGDEISFRIGAITRVVRVKDFPANRVSAKLVPDFIDDLTSPEEYEKIKLMKELGPPVFHSGKGRPTKKDRRKMDGFF
ncbi:MAG TPA: RNA-binding S4 domain-containing protein [Bacteroidia bacterium]|nr:RNA-binding S4 domain-containing protein [Bacteroidia bacterium]